MTIQKRTFFIVIFALTTIGLVSVSCNNDKKIPAFIVINKEDITVLYNSTLGTGSTAHDFSDVWVNVNGTILGCWELPARIPVLEQGSCNIVVKAGIILNGMKSSHSAYSFFKFFETTVDLEPHSETRLYPVFAYIDNLSSPASSIENFESAGIRLTPSSDSQAGIDKIETPNLIYKNPYDSLDVNHYSGFTELKDTAFYFDLRSENLELFSDGTYRTFFECNYNIDAKNDPSNPEASVGIGLIAVSSSGNTTHYPVVMLNPSEGQWKKIYVDLSQVVGQNYTARYFVLQITGFRETHEKAVKFYFDNLRIIQHPSYY